MNFYLLFALLASLSGCSASCSNCATCSSGTCSLCNTGYYLTGASCTACKTCTSSQWKSAACTITTDTVCNACATCPSPQYVSVPCTATSNAVCSNCSAACPSTSDYRLMSLCGGSQSGCLGCNDCASNGGYTKAYGVCAGPAHTCNPECLAPGPALCEACYHIDEWHTNGLDPEDPFYSEYCTNSRSDAWWFLGGKDSTDLVTCCDAARAFGAAGNCEFNVPNVVQTNNSCLFNYVYDCMGIASTWPNHTPYPEEPQDPQRP